VRRSQGCLPPVKAASRRLAAAISSCNVNKPVFRTDNAIIVGTPIISRNLQIFDASNMRFEHSPK
jgi:hypothetical protein